MKNSHVSKREIEIWDRRRAELAMDVLLAIVRVVVPLAAAEQRGRAAGYDEALTECW